jgi:hypothetical protein
MKKVSGAGEEVTMMKHAERGELDVIPPLGSVTITLDVSPLEIELALATSGVSLCRAR